MRTLIISDIHANQVALERVLATRHAQSADQIWCLGDLVGYGPNPNECVELLHDCATLCLVGNHDWAALGKLDLREFNEVAKAALLWTQRTLSEESRSFLAGLEGRLDGAVPDFTLAHASPRYPIWEYLLEPEEAAENFPHFDTRFCLVGHTHRPQIFQKAAGYAQVASFLPRDGTTVKLNEIGDLRLILNPGSVGQPRDGDPRAAYALYDDERCTISFHRVAYDIARTQGRMRAARLPRRLIQRLEVGW